MNDKIVIRMLVKDDYPSNTRNERGRHAALR